MIIPTNLDDLRNYLGGVLLIAERGEVVIAEGELTAEMQISLSYRTGHVEWSEINAIEGNRCKRDRNIGN